MTDHVVVVIVVVHIVADSPGCNLVTVFRTRITSMLEILPG